MSPFTAQLRSMAVGSLPHADPDSACQLLMDTLDIPNWPQLPKRTFLENMYTQFSERFPGIVVADQRIYVDRNRDLDPELEQLYVAYLMNDLDYAVIGREYAVGLHHFLKMDLGQASVIKGQVTGPVSWGLMVADQNRRPVLYEDVLAEALAKHLRLKATWMEEELRKTAHQTIVIVDEPYMSSFGSAFVSLNREQVIGLMEEVLAGIEGLKGVHCCGNTDWSLMLATTADILSLDAYEYAESLALYPEEVGSFLSRGGVIGWGIVPASDRALEETAEGLIDRFHQAVGLLTAKGIHQDDLLAASLIMPSCGCGSLSIETTEQVLALTAQVARALQERYA
jgi:methionine synthase II (cobalamin-independent)